MNQEVAGRTGREPRFQKRVTSRLIHILAPVCFLFVLGAGRVMPVLAQEDRSVDPFSSIEVSAGGAYDLGGSLFHQYWTNGTGGELYVSSPFYFGAAEIGGSFHRYKPVGASGVPSFDALLLTAGWNVYYQPTPPVKASAGVRFGNYRMAFDTETFEGVRNESEFTVVGVARVQIYMGRRFFAYGSAEYQRTFTYIRLRPVFVTFGLGYHMSSPHWLRNVLK